MPLHFANRTDAGKQLARILEKFRGQDAIVYALPRGGVVLGYEIARALKVPLDLIITRKIGHPQNPEYAVCAISEAGDLICNEEEKAALDPDWLKQASKTEWQEAVRRRRAYLPDGQTWSAEGKIAIIVDDGIATGLTMLAAIAAIKRQSPKKLVVAVPVAPYETLLTLRKIADEVIVLDDGQGYLGAVGSYYDDFPQVSDEEVIALILNAKP